MIKKLLSFYLFICFTFISNSQTIDTSYVDGAVYLKIHDTTTTQLDLSANGFPLLANLFTSYSVTNVDQPFKNINIGLSHTYRLTFSQFSAVSTFINALQQIAYVDYAERVPLFYTSQIPNDLQTNQWYLNKINATLAWDISTGSVNVKIAIVDNAVSNTHDDLTSSVFINAGEIPNNGLDDDFNGYIDDVKGYDVANSNNNPNPPSSAGSNSPWIHGTHCAGIASASTNNGIGMAGIGYNCSIIPVKCTPNSSNGNTLSSAYEGVAYAMNAGADVISMSFGSAGNSFTGQNIINAAFVQGIALVAAAGNEDSSNPYYPAAYSQVISVGATDISDQRASFSNYGTTIDVMAPGVSIYSTISGANDAYGTLSGTSMACPLTAGLCGLIKSQDPSRTPTQIKSILVSGCDNIDVMNPNYVGQIGAGRINAFNSLSGSALALDYLSILKVSISPNPFIDEMTILVSENSTLTIYSANGQVIEKLADQNDSFKIGSDYKSGLYFVRVESGSKVEVFKVLKL